MALTGKNFRSDGSEENQTDEQIADVLTEQENKQSEEAQEQNDNSGEENKDENFDWDDLKGSFETDEDEKPEFDESGKPVQVQEKAAEVEKEEKPDASKEWWEKAAEVSNIKANSEEEYIAAAKEAAAPKVTYVRTDNPELVELNKLLDLSPEERVAAALKMDGYAVKDIADRVKFLKDTNQLGFEDTKITKNIRNEIGRINQSVKQKTEATQKAHVEQVNTFVKNIETAIEKKDTIFGLSFGKDPDSIKTNKALIVNDLKNGGLGKMISELGNKALEGDADALIEAYYAIKFRDKLQVGWKNKGAAEASRKILDEIHNNKQENGSYEDVKDKTSEKSDGKGKTFR